MRTVGVIGIILSLLCGLAAATPVPIVNNGFDVFILDEMHYTLHPSVVYPPSSRVVYTLDPIPGWTVPEGREIGTFHPTTAQYFADAPEADNVAYIHVLGGAFSQTLSTTLAGNTR
jgi:hypothetical protein